MAKPTTISAAKLSIWVGNGESPEVFAAPCGLTTRGIKFSADSNSIVVPDCNDPDLPAWIERVVRSLSVTINGSGVLAKEALQTWREWFLSGAPLNVRVVLDGVGWGYFSGSFILSSFEVTGEIGNKVQTTIQADSDGPVTWTDGAPS